MKTASLFLFLIITLVGSCHQAEQATQVALPLTLVDGYGPFHPGFSALGNDHKNDSEGKKLWGKMYLSVTGIPKHWSHVDKAIVWLNSYQLVYQNYLAGNITKAWFNHLQESWKWVPDTLTLSKKPIKCYVYTLHGFDEEKGKWAVMIDTDNDLDFSDETATYPEVIKNTDPYSYKNPSIVNYEVYRNGQVVKMKIPMVIKTMGSEFLYNFPQHAQTTFRKDGKEYKLSVISGFTNPDFENSAFVESSSFGEGQRVSEDKLIKINENIRLDGVTYKNKGVDFYNNVLRLDPLSDDNKEYSLQIGYPFRPFSAQEFTSKQPITLADYKGKYVYVDFWGTWCKGCVNDIPKLKKLYAGLDKNQFEFIGIVQDSSEKLTKFIQKQDVQWPQILSDKGNKLVETYGITGYPTSVLLDHDGVVIARNLQGDQLRNKLKELREQ
ncbi:hypothetical protein GCM10028818_38300 [Spirosoma horti]